MPNLASIGQLWNAYASRASLKQERRLRNLEGWITTAAQHLAQGKASIRIFGQYLSSGDLDLRGLNAVLRQEGSRLRLFYQGGELILARIHSETVNRNIETYYFEEEIFSNIERNAIALASNDGVIAIRRISLESHLRHLAALAFLGREQRIQSTNLDIMAHFLEAFGIFSEQQFEAQLGFLMDNIQELEYVHERGHITRAAQPIFSAKSLFTSIAIIDEILCDLEVLEHIVRTKDAALARRLMLYSLAQSLTAMGGSLINQDRINEIRYAFMSAVLLRYFDSPDYQNDILNEISKMRVSLLGLASRVEAQQSKAAEPNPPEILAQAPPQKVNTTQLGLGNGYILLLAEPLSMPALLRERASVLKPPFPIKEASVDGTNPEAVAEHSIARTARLKHALRKPSYLDLVPVEYHGRIRAMVEKACHTKGAGMSKEEFTELMAHYWLAAKESFKIIAQSVGFELVEEAAADLDSAILVLTESGSILALTKPHYQTLKRQVIYQRIKAREDTDIRPCAEATIQGPIRIGSHLHLINHLKTSDVIAIAVNPKARLIDLQDSVISMTRTQNTLGNTLWRMRTPKKDE